MIRHPDQRGITFFTTVISMSKARIVKKGEEKSYAPCKVRLAVCISSLTIVRDDISGKKPVNMVIYKPGQPLLEIGCLTLKL